MPTSPETKVHDQVRAARREAYRLAILEAARSLFEAQGFRAITMADIAKAAGVAKGTLYNYFDSKEEVFAALAERGRTEFLTELDAMMGDKIGWDRLDAAVHHTLSFFARHSSMMHVYFEATGGATESAADPRAGVGQKAFVDRFVECLEHLSREGRLSIDFPIPFAVISLLGSIEAISRVWITTGEQPDIPKAAAQILHLFRQGAEA